MRLRIARRTLIHLTGCVAAVGAGYALWLAVPALVDAGRFFPWPWRGPVPEFMGPGALVVSGISLLYGGGLAVIAAALLTVAALCLEPRRRWRAWRRRTAAAERGVEAVE